MSLFNVFSSVGEWEDDMIGHIGVVAADTAKQALEIMIQKDAGENPTFGHKVEDYQLVTAQTFDEFISEWELNYFFGGNVVAFMTVPKTGCVYAAEAI